MSLSRREFIKLCGASAAGVGLSQLAPAPIVEALEKAAAGNPPVVWIMGQGCTGCSVSILNTVHPTIEEVLTKIISMKFHETVMAASGELAIEAMEKTAEEYPGKFYLVVEGSIPTDKDGMYCQVGTYHGNTRTILTEVVELGRKAAAVAAVGTDACYGGIPAARPNPTGAKSVMEIFKEYGIKTPVINIPGCPPNPDWMVGTLAHVLLYGIPELDELGRPLLFYGQLIHDNCPYRGYFEYGVFAKKFGDEGCRYELGCKGPETYADCWKRRWNNGVNWCVQNALCIGCVQPDFWDKYEPIYESLG
ncbi:MAG: hydrogenase small subunit [Deltaproteobacteria bacterium]|nr:hydrogenase small subunit [Deltaproteobacteria bacterium]MBW2071017.1 hydrogenase small subunit [Deltaproteobacteria bacterium]